MIDSEFLRRWSEALLAANGEQLPDNVPPYVAQHRSVLRPPAFPGDVEGAEQRLGAELPPSYRQFLAHSDGAYASGVGLTIGSWWDSEGSPGEQGMGFLPAGALAPDQPDMAREWAAAGLEGVVDPNYRVQIPEWEYLDYDQDQDPVMFKTGHYRHCLAITTEHDGYAVLLNPFVRQPNGEWETWDFGSKIPGAHRHPSFEALLESQMKPGEPIGFEVDVDAAVATLDRYDLTETERATALHQLWVSGLDGDEHPRWRQEALRMALDPTVDRYQRGNQARSIARTLEVESLLLLLDDPEPLVWQAAVPALVYVGAESTRETLVTVLSREDLDGLVVRSLWLSDPLEVAWAAYEVSGNLDLLAYSCKLGQPAAQREFAARMNDQSVEPDQRRQLAASVWGERLEAGLAEDLIAASELPGAPLRELATLLTPLAPDSAVPLWRRVLLDREVGAYAADASWNLKKIGTPEALDVLVEAGGVQTHHGGAIIDALGGFPEPRAVSAIESYTSEESLLLDVVYALETQGIPEARDVLASIGHIQSWRALARLGDERCREPLLAARRSENPELSREALEGLRELSDPTTAGHLLEVLAEVDPDSDEAAVCAHVLAVMRVPESVEVLERLRSSSSDRSLHNVVDIWLSQLS